MTRTDGREVEIKHKVRDAAALARVRAALQPTGPVVTVVQQNHFFDSATRALDRERMVLRLRLEGDQAFLTAKGAVNDATGIVTIKLEEECAVPVGLLDDAVRGRCDLLKVLCDDVNAGPSRPALINAMRKALAGTNLVSVGVFHNRRTRVPTLLPVSGSSIPVLFELDVTTFPGDIVHHEVEVEVPDDVEPDAMAKAVQVLLDNAAVSSEPAIGKAARFFAALRGELPR